MLWDGFYFGSSPEIKDLAFSILEKYGSSKFPFERTVLGHWHGPEFIRNAIEDGSVTPVIYGETLALVRLAVAEGKDKEAIGLIEYFGGRGGDDIVPLLEGLIISVTRSNNKLREDEKNGVRGKGYEVTSVQTFIRSGFTHGPKNVNPLDVMRKMGLKCHELGSVYAIRGL